MVSMATCTSEMPVRKFALGEENSASTHVASKHRGGLRQYPRNGSCKNISGDFSSAVLSLCSPWLAYRG